MVLPVDRFFRINQRTRRHPFGDDDYDTKGLNQGRPKKGEPTKAERDEANDEITNEEKGQDDDC